MMTIRCIPIKDTACEKAHHFALKIAANLPYYNFASFGMVIHIAMESSDKIVANLAQIQK